MHFWIKHFDLIFFDFDGLLVDTEPLHYKAYKEALWQRGYDLPWDFKRYKKTAMSSAFALRDDIYTLFPALYEKEPNWEIIRNEKQEIYRHLLESTPPTFMPGVLDLLKLLQKHKKCHALVTNSSRLQIELCASHHKQLKNIPIWITREDYKSPKPASDPYLCALEKCKKEGNRIIAFEDSIKGIEALKGTGILPILICEENHPQFCGAPPCKRFDSFIELNSFVTIES